MTPTEPTQQALEALDNKKIIAWLFKIQQRKLNNDTGDGYVTVREVANAFGVEKKEMRAALDRLADQGLIRRLPFSNCLCFMSNNPLPWENLGHCRGVTVSYRLSGKSVVSRTEKLSRAKAKLLAPKITVLMGAHQ